MLCSLLTRLQKVLNLLQAREQPGLGTIYRWDDDCSLQAGSGAGLLSESQKEG